MIYINSLKNKSILITGGTGSIGSGLVKYLIKTECKVIRIMSNDENGLYEISRNLGLDLTAFDNFSRQMKLNKIRFFLGDVRDYNRCEEVSKNVDIVIHAAALKHVSIVEYNPKEAHKTNVIGTKNMIKASIKNKVKKFLLLSTDKVVTPTNIMGKTKLKAEKIMQKFKKKTQTKVSAIRFGNVLGSRGSVVPNFINLLQKKKNITVTDKRMARFVMSLEEAIKSVIKSLHLMKGNEVFISKSMKCFKIYELAQALIVYFSRVNKKTNKIIFSKKNVGEKFEEELYLESEIPYIKFKNGLFIITKNKKNHKRVTINYLKKHRISNYNFLDTSEIINLLIKLRILERPIR
jgi:UDP-N-acetylglucosamine 4,6-dehydratase